MNDASNPFFEVSPPPYHLPPFERIRDEHYAPAFDAGMRLQREEAEAIASQTGPATFDNTIVALERSGQLLARVRAAFANMVAANTNDTLAALEREIAPKMAAHTDRIMLDARLFGRIEALYAQRAGLALDAEAQYLLERYHTDFVRAGATLSASDKARLSAVNAELATLATGFSQNVRKESVELALVLDTRAELDGMPAAAIEGAAAAARARGLEGKFVLDLVNTTDQPPLALLRNRDVRRRLLAASIARGINGGQYDNRALVLTTVRLRAERAALLGYPNYAAYLLEDQTARSAGAVNALLAELARPALANARREADQIQAVIDAEAGSAAEAGAGATVAAGSGAAAGPGRFQLAAHDWAYYAEKVRTARFSFDERSLKPYFEMNNVLVNGVFFAASKLYGISFQERHDLPLYHPDVRVFEVGDADGKPLALFLADFYARGNKRGGAWMNAFVSQSALLERRAVVGNHLNVPKPPPGEPTLLTFDEVVTMFHEFGHALHGMFSNVTYPRFSGTAVPRDFVEYPSQVNEMWAVWPEVLRNYARHYATGAPMPRDLLDKVLAAKKFNQGFLTTEYLAAALLDQRWHQLTPDQVPADPVAFEARALREAGVDFAPVPPRYRSGYFAHSFSGGYAAGYYAYIWSEKLDADTALWFRERGGLLRKNGDWFRRQVLSRGGGADPLQLFRAFRGRDAAIGALLERRGLQSE